MKDYQFLVLTSETAIVRSEIVSEDYLPANAYPLLGRLVDAIEDTEVELRGLGVKPRREDDPAKPVEPPNRPSNPAHYEP